MRCGSKKLFNLLKVSFRQGHTETLVVAGILVVLALVIGIAGTVQRYRHSDQFAWWEWIAGPLFPLGALFIAVAAILLLAFAVDKLGFLHPTQRPRTQVDDDAWEAVRYHVFREV